MMEFSPLCKKLSISSKETAGVLTEIIVILQYQKIMKYWIFDFDGTLVDTDGLFYQCLEYTLKPFEVEVQPDFMEQIRHKHPHRIFEDLLPPSQSKIAMERLKRAGAELSEGIEAFPGIKEVLTTIENNKGRLAIWTGRDGESTRRILTRLGLVERFETIITGTCVETNKPGHDGLLTIKDFFRAKPHEMVMVGDHHHDISPANDLGLHSVHARWKSQPQDLPKEVKPHWNFNCTQTFLKWIEDQFK